MKKPVFWLLAASSVLSALLQAQPAMAQDNASASKGSAAQNSAKFSLQVGSVLYVTTDKLNLRSKAVVASDTLVGYLTKNDQVEVLDLLDNSSSLVKIKIVKSSVADNSIANDLYVSAEYLSKQKAAVETSSAGGSKYIIIQNVATERMRIYERCTATPDCAHRLVMETEMVVGRTEGPKQDRDQFITWLGRYKVTEWKKFYQDAAEHYPSWYDPNSPALPKPGSSAQTWLSKKYVPNRDSGGELRGAFGWYAAMVGPNANSQWIHGTFGWGSDGDMAIKATRGFWANLFGNPRSHGCTRLENRAIALARHLASPGTEVLRVYAKEAYRDASRSAYANQKADKPWEFILTKEDVRKSGGSSADKQSVLARGVSSSLYLEQGTYSVDQFPTGVGLSKGASAAQRRKGDSGNSYDISDDGFRGAFLVDEGRFVNYSHPSGLPVGGLPERALPAYMTTSGDFTFAESRY